MGALAFISTGAQPVMHSSQDSEFSLADLGLSADSPVLKNLRFHEKKDRNGKQGQEDLRGKENNSYTFYRFLFGLTPDFP